MAKEKLPALSKIKKALFADWALRVKQRDGFKCLICGSEEKLTSHHWHVCDHNAHMARYCVANGATLCYTCHIRGVHQRADYVSVRAVRDAVMSRYRTNDGFETELDLEHIETLAKLEVTTEGLRSLYAAMQKRVISLPRVYGFKGKSNKMFVTGLPNETQAAVVGNIVSFCGLTYEVTAIGKVDLGEDGKCFRYTLKPFEVKE